MKSSVVVKSGVEDAHLARLMKCDLISQLECQVSKKLLGVPNNGRGSPAFRSAKVDFWTTLGAILGILIGLGDFF